MTNGGQRPDASGFQIENEMDLLFGRAHPNPAREGCPTADLLRLLSRRERPIEDPAYNHLAQCSPCYRELRALQQAESARNKASLKRWRMAYAAVIGVVLVTLAAWLVLG